MRASPARKGRGRPTQRGRGRDQRRGRPATATRDEGESDSDDKEEKEKQEEEEEEEEEALVDEEDSDVAILMAVSWLALSALSRITPPADQCILCGRPVRHPHVFCRSCWHVGKPAVGVPHMREKTSGRHKQVEPSGEEEEDWQPAIPGQYKTHSTEDLHLVRQGHLHDVLDKAQKPSQQLLHRRVDR